MSCLGCHVVLGMARTRDRSTAREGVSLWSEDTPVTPMQYYRGMQRSQPACDYISTADTFFLSHFTQGEGETAENNAKYLRIMRETIKDERHDALMLGEHFHEATAWLQGDQEDCSMNYYGFMRPVRMHLSVGDWAKTQNHIRKNRTTGFGGQRRQSGIDRKCALSD